MKAAPRASAANKAASVPGSVVRVRIFLPKPQVPLGNPVLPVICLGHFYSETAKKYKAGPDTRTASTFLQG